MEVNRGHAQTDRLTACMHHWHDQNLDQKRRFSVGEA
jgi:hypothetical protein